MGARSHSLTDGSLSTRRRRTLLVLWFEAVAAAGASSVGVLAAYVAAALFGVGGAWVFVVALLLALAALAFEIWRFAAPTAAAVDRRIEAAGGLRHRPMAVLNDTPAMTGPLAAALWAAHRAQAAAAVNGAPMPLPALRMTARDPLALRGLLVLMLLCGLVVAGPAAPGRLAAALVLPEWRMGGAAEVTAWVTPPDYAGGMPVLLQPGQAVTALKGSRLTVIVDGWRDPVVHLRRTRFVREDLAGDAGRAEAVLERSGRLVVGPWWQRLGGWNVRVVPPAAPVLRFNEVTAVDGNHLRIEWRVQDNYGLARMSARLAPVGFAKALVTDVALDASGSGGVVDITASAFRNLPLGLTLTAVNMAGVSVSVRAPNHLALPPAALHDRTAKALAQWRQTLALAPERLSGIGGAMAALARHPASGISGGADAELAYLGAAMAGDQIGAAPAVDRLWYLIEQIEAGRDFVASRALAQADAALLRALQQGLDGKAPDTGTLQKLLQAMQQALAQHLAAIAPPGGKAMPEAGGRVMSMQSLDDLAQQIARDESAGRSARAARELQQLQDDLNALKTARPMTAAQAARAQAQAEAQARAAAQAAQALGQLMNGEAKLLDHTNRGTATPGEQTRLQRGLDAMRDGLGQQGMFLPGAGQAAQNMQSAQSALAQGDLPAAAAAEARAIQSLQQAAASLAAAQRQMFDMGQTQPGTTGNNGDGVNGGTDDMDEPAGAAAPDPAAVIQQQILRRDEAPNVPAATHQYYRRLLTPDQ